MIRPEKRKNERGGFKGNCPVISFAAESDSLRGPLCRREKG